MSRWRSSAEQLQPPARNSRRRRSLSRLLQGQPPPWPCALLLPCSVPSAIVMTATCSGTMARLQACVLVCFAPLAMHLCAAYGLLRHSQQSVFSVGLFHIWCGSTTISQAGNSPGSLGHAFHNNHLCLARMGLTQCTLTHIVYYFTFA